MELVDNSDPPSSPTATSPSLSSTASPSSTTMSSPDPTDTSSTPSYLQKTAAHAQEHINKGPKQRAAERRAQQEAEGTYQAPVYGGVKKVPSSRQNTQRKKEPPPVLTSWKEKGFSLKTAFNKATWGINLAKAFAPKMELGARNRVKVGVRFRPLNASEEKRGDADKQKGFLTLEPVVGHVTLTRSMLSLTLAPHSSTPRLMHDARHERRAGLRSAGSRSGCRASRSPL